MMSGAVRILLVGDEMVGKTSLAERFTEDRAPDHSQATIGVEYHAVQCGDRKVRFWDTAGAERFRSITRTYYRSGDAVWLCFDGSDARSFARLAFWTDELGKSIAPGVPVLLLALKGDLPARPPDADVAAFAELHSFEGWERLSAQEQSRAALHAQLLPRLAAVEGRDAPPDSVVVSARGAALDCCTAQ